MSRGRKLLLFLVATVLVALLAAGGAAASTYSRSAPIHIGPDAGPAKPYPSQIGVYGVPGAVTEVRASLHVVSHAYSADVDVLLMAPGGQHTLLMSSACGDDTSPLIGQSFTFTDLGPRMPLQGICLSGSYRPTFDPLFPPMFPLPAPGGAHTTTAMSALNGSPASGPWRLFVFDNEDDDAGAIGGWSLDLLTDAKCSKQTATITGTHRPDFLAGTSGRDVILGFGGNDTIHGFGGKDVICGGPGNDKILGGDGRDVLLGQSGEDKIEGGKGSDNIKGGNHGDELLGQGGKDTIRGGKGRDKLLGDRGRDTLNGGGGRDVCKGGKDRDTAKSCEKEKSL